MKYCKKCVMPDTRPGIIFDNEGVCSACRNYEYLSTVNWQQRWIELEQLCSKYRNINGKGYPDCIIAISGGKDSHFQTHIFKEKLRMNPILVTVEDNFSMTEAGIHNLKNISEEFGCHIISLKPNIKVQKKVMRYTFEKYAKPNYIIDRYIYTYPLYIAVKFSIPLIVYGENVSFTYGGFNSKETYSAREQISNGVASGIELEELLENCRLTEDDLIFFNPPESKDIEKLEPIYLSYFVKWNSYRNYVFARKRGFRDLTHEWKRTNHIEDYDQIDSRAYLVHPWLKYPKFGHGPATDYASRLIRYGLITREEGINLVREYDHKLDPLAVRDFCQFLGYRESEFWAIVDKFYNPDLFTKNEFGEWVLKNPIWEQ
ncbi:MAG: N-acetyl sugar amidotransferase [bacterium]